MEGRNALSNTQTYWKWVIHELSGQVAHTARRLVKKSNRKQRKTQFSSLSLLFSNTQHQQGQGNTHRKQTLTSVQRKTPALVVQSAPKHRRPSADYPLTCLFAPYLANIKDGEGRRKKEHKTFAAPWTYPTPRYWSYEFKHPFVYLSFRKTGTDERSPRLACCVCIAGMKATLNCAAYTWGGQTVCF